MQLNEDGETHFNDCDVVFLRWAYYVGEMIDSVISFSASIDILRLATMRSASHSPATRWSTAGAIVSSYD